MQTKEIADNYNAVAQWWLEQMRNSSYGLPALERALAFAKTSGAALDVGCGCEGRFIRTLLARGFQCTGIDISSEMIRIIAERFTAAEFVVGDIATWLLPQKYDLITAWDSTFHLPLDQQEPVLAKLCAALNPDGVLLFTCGGGDEPGEVSGEFGGKPFTYSTLGVREFVWLLSEFGCSMRYLDYDQYPEKHVTIVAQKT